MSDKTLQYATDILSKIQSKQIDPDQLTTEQRRIVVRFLFHDRKMTKTEMAEVLKVARSTIYEDRKAIDREEVGATFIVDEIEMVKDLVSSAEVAIARLFRKGKEKEAFDVQDKLIDRLQTLGYVKRVAQEHNLRGQISLLEVLGLGTNQPTRSTDASEGFFTPENERRLGADQDRSDQGH